MTLTVPRALAERPLALLRRRWHLFLAAGGLLLLGGVAFLFVGTVPIPSPPQSTKLLAADGQVIANLHGVEDRTIVPLSAISPALGKAVVATEDRGFYSHAGVSPRGIVRALFTNVREGGVRQGGSTLTQQYVRNAFESVGRKRSVFRKLREAALAIKLERSYSKDKILELYLNTVYFGRGAYGAEAASRTYFGKPAKDLTLSEAAYLAGVIRSPERLQPDDSDANAGATRVRDEVLDDMVRNRAISQAEAATAKAQPFTFSRNPTTAASSTRAAYFVEYVRRILHSEFDLTDTEILAGGLRIETTLDLKAQDAANKAVSSTFDRPDDPEAALVAIDSSGNIRAMVGGRDVKSVERARGFNYAYQSGGSGGGRQAGSAFKPFVLASFVEQGYSVRSWFDAPPSIRIRSDQCRNGDGTSWHVSNYDHDGYGRLDVTSATARSVNTVYAQLIDRVGPQNVADLAQRLGGWESIPRLCSIALGTPTVTPLQMARAFSTFAGRGERPVPIAVTRIVAPDGKVVARRRPRTEHVIDANLADTVNDVLQDVLKKGTAKGKGIGRPAAGKTGTTQNHIDAWFVGYTPSLTAAVWVGFPPDRATGKVPPMDDVRGRRVTGGSFPATIWEHFMRDALRGTEEEDFVAPEVGGKVIGEPPPPPSPLPTCVDAFGFPVFCPSPLPAQPPPTLPSPVAPPPLLPLPTALPSLPINPLLPLPRPSPRRTYLPPPGQPVPGYPAPSPTYGVWP